MNTIRILLWVILVYYIALHAIYLLLLLIGSLQVRRYNRAITFAEFRRIGESRLSMPVSLIIPCFNEAAIICATIRNILRLTYPQFEVIVVSDGSTDGTMEILAESFKLRRVDRFGRRYIGTEQIRSVHESPDYPNLVVVDKVNGRASPSKQYALTRDRPYAV